jgi:hypothetical protein
MLAFAVVCQHSSAAINHELYTICKEHSCPASLSVDITPEHLRAYELATDGDTSLRLPVEVVRRPRNHTVVAPRGSGGAPGAREPA